MKRKQVVLENLSKVGPSSPVSLLSEASEVQRSVPGRASSKKISKLCCYGRTEEQKDHGGGGVSIETSTAIQNPARIGIIHKTTARAILTSDDS